MHIPVLTNEILEYLAVKPQGIYIDATTGMGGHTVRIAEKLTTGWVLANDRDSESLAIAKSNISSLTNRVRYRQGSFSGLKTTLSELGAKQADGLIADLGSSRFQLTTSERGFSLMADGPLDMRMDRTQGMTAAELVNTASEKDIADLIYKLGEERRARKIARAIVRGRPLHTTMQLAKVVEKAAPRYGRIHPATRTFMALRLAVNEEQQELDRLLEQIPDIVRSGGRAVVLSFMSLEDRKVKWSFRDLAKQGRATILTKHVVTPTRQEVLDNPASRSAKLRAIELR